MVRVSTLPYWAYSEMSAEDTAGTLTEENVLPQEPADVADQIASADALPADAAAALREDQIQNAINFLSHPKVRVSAFKDCSSNVKLL